MKPILALLTSCAALVLGGSPATADDDVLPAATVRAEMVRLYEGLEGASYDLYAHRDEEDYRRFLTALTRSVDRPQTRQETAILLQRLAAHARIGHTRVDAPVSGFMEGLAAGVRFLPVFIRVDDGRVLLTEAPDAAGRFAAGDEILSIDGEPVGAWLERLTGYVSAERPYMAHTLMEQSFPLLLNFALGDVDSVTLIARKPSGEVVTAELPAVTLIERAGIRNAHPTGALDTDFSTRSFEILAGNVGYLRPGPFASLGGAGPDGSPNYDAAEFGAFIDGSFETLLASGATDLIIDLRNNPGGNNSFSDLMVAWFADRPFRFASSFELRASAETKAWYAANNAAEDQDETLRALAEAEADQANGSRYRFDLPMTLPRDGDRFDGRVHVLVNRSSFSNAASVAALIQDYGFGQILGEETADLPTTYASVLTFALPATGILVTYPKSRIIRPNGDQSLVGVVPDWPIARPPIGETEDSVLEAALRLVTAQAAERTPWQ